MADMRATSQSVTSVNGLHPLISDTLHPGIKGGCQSEPRKKPDLGYGIIISSSTVIILNFPCRALTSLRVTSVAKLEMFKMTCKNATIPPTSQI
ncbi:unnamed protein product [Clonostachys rosea f. rosea IK726]|uniref:Uncharacterized protein n=1 Tax=Clonostachys rosea f. rosea IK726 TaxID=1349383 RepID=A0ACA9TRN5_BIOOC|nr:unnamed protein product [Clonostachys rosea f. rosea IK726]